MTSDVETIKKEISALSAKDRKDVYLYISLLVKDESVPHDYALAGHLLRVLNETSYPLLRWPEHVGLFPSPIATLFWTFQREVEDFLTRYCTDLMKSQRAGFLEILMAIKYKHIKKKLEYVAAPLTIKAFLQDKTGLEALIDSAYPGYLAAGNIRILYPKIKRGVRGSPRLG